MEKKTYIVVADAYFLQEKDLMYKFLSGTNEDIEEIYNDNYDRDDGTFGIYELDDFIRAMNDDKIDCDGAFFRKLIR